MTVSHLYAAADIEFCYNDVESGSMLSCTLQL